MRKNPDSLRVHGLRLAADPLPTEQLRAPHKAQNETHQSMTGQHVAETFELLLMDGVNGATGEMRRESARLLTVADVASLLHVHVSWVYGRMRRRSLDRLPGYRLGKYWRFRADEIHAWIECQSRGHRAS
jgi:excisionase family DNA binding protein